MNVTPGLLAVQPVLPLKLNEKLDRGACTFFRASEWVHNATPGTLVAGGGQRPGATTCDPNGSLFTKIFWDMGDRALPLV